MRAMAASGSLAGPSGAEAEKASATEGALADGLVSLLTPMVAKCDDGVQQALNSQAILSQQLDRVASELQTFLAASQIPSFSPQAQRLADVRRRVVAANATLMQVQARLSRIDELADRLQEQDHLTLRRTWPDGPGPS